METSSAPRTWQETQVVLRDRLPNYEERPQQTLLAEAIEEAFENETPLVGQAGTGCIQGDAEVVINRGGNGRRYRLDEVVEKFNGGGKRKWDLSIPTMIQREDDDGTIRLAQIVNAWCSGEKMTYAVTTDSGRTLRATDEHPFLTERGWLRLDELIEGDVVHVRGGQGSSGRASKKNYSMRSGLVGHPYASRREARDHAFRYPTHRLVAEARENHMEFEVYLAHLRTGDVDGLTFLDPEVWAVHHIDLDHKNNEADNLKVLTHQEHHRLHAALGVRRNVLYKVAFERVVSIEPYGVEMTYDIEVADDPHNFIVNGFVVHNTGKSLAALVPMILSGQPSYYSTGTKALQAQLMDKDLPFLRESLGINFRYAMLQGRSNYVCHSQLTSTLDDSDPVLADIRSAVDRDDEDNYGQFEITTRESLGFEVDDQTWRKASISSDNCLRKDCPFFASHCRAQYAKAVANEAHVVVVNHALVATDAKLYQDTGGEVTMLGAIENLVIDEAHELEQYVINALEGKFSAGTFRAIAAFLRSAARKVEIDEADIDPLLVDMQASAEAMIAALPADGRIRHAKVIEHVAEVEGAIRGLDPVIELFEDVDPFLLESRAQTTALNMARRRLANLRQRLTDFLLKRDSEVVRFVEIDGDRKSIVTRPIEVGEWMRDNMWTRYTPVVMSATILVDGSAEYIRRTLGIEGGRVVDVGSPFDYRTNSRLYVPSTITTPVGRDRDRWAAEMYPQVLRMVEASKGRALLLFTSRSQMRDAFFTLRKDLQRLGLEVRMQGDESNARLTRWMRETGGVLFGTKSFFTGIDVQGQNLSLVVIDKLPFPVPTDPVFEARSELLEARGGNPFSQLSIPEMSLPLQQAFGRLIRTMSDKGVVAIMDPRITGKGYGKKISGSIPAPLTINLDEVERFLAEIA